MVFFWISVFVNVNRVSIHLKSINHCEYAHCIHLKNVWLWWRFRKVTLIRCLIRYWSLILYWNHVGPFSTWINKECFPNCHGPRVTYSHTKEKGLLRRPSILTVSYPSTSPALLTRYKGDTRLSSKGSLIVGYFRALTIELWISSPQKQKRMPMSWRI